ncbi:MAG: hypothetical protein AAGD05_00700, partial [Bacteroidota bacterium]
MERKHTIKNIWWEQLTQIGVQEHLSDADIFKIRFFNGAMGVVAVLDAVEGLLFLALGLYTLLWFKLLIALVLALSFYFQQVGAYKTALRCFGFGSASLILLFSILFGGVIGVSAFWLTLVTIIFFVKRDSPTRYHYIFGFVLGIMATYWVHFFYEPLLVLEAIEWIEMIFIPSALVIQVILINLFNNELKAQEEKKNRQQQQLNAAVSLTQATLEATTDGLLVVNRQGDITNFNQKFVQMWQLPDHLLAIPRYEQLMVHLLDQLK